MLLKSIVLAILALIIYCLCSGLIYLIRNKSESTEMARALTWRVGLSVGLFMLLIIAYFMGYIEPHSVLASGKPVLLYKLHALVAQ